MAFLTTSLEDRGDRLRFVVTTVDAVARERLPHLGYPAIAGGRFATRWFPASAQPARYFDHFSASIETIVRQSARLVAVPWEDALLEFLDRVGESGLEWWLYGSAALAVRGLPVAPGDIDVRVDDAVLAGRIFDDALVTPVERMDGWVAAYAGRAFRHAWSSGSPSRTRPSTIPRRRTSTACSWPTASRRSRGAGARSASRRSTRSYASASAAGSRTGPR